MIEMKNLIFTAVVTIGCITSITGCNRESTDTTWKYNIQQSDEPKKTVKKETFEGWTVAVKFVDYLSKGKEEYTCFMGTRNFSSGNKYVILEASPININVLMNLFKTREDAIDFWKTGLWWDSCRDRRSIPLYSVLPVKIKFDIDISCLELDCINLNYWKGR